MTCLYCLKPRPFNEEHVLARALAGGGENWVLRDVVCSDCNKLFSRFERAWTSEPSVAMARIAWGPVGRRRKGQAFHFHPSDRMFLEVDGDPVSYEADILPGIAPRFRYQVIDTGMEIRSVASHRDDIGRFQTAWNAFISKPEVTISKRRAGQQVSYRVATLKLGALPVIERVERRSKPAGAWWDTFGVAFARSCDPRMSLDPFGRIRFRTEHLKQIPSLLRSIFAAGEIGGSGAVHPPGSYHMKCRGLYDAEKIHRAVAKTAANYLVDRMGRYYADQRAFRPLLNYCIGGGDSTGPGPFVGIVSSLIGIPDFDRLPVERHCLGLFSDGVRVVGALKLYGAASSYRVHLGPSPDGAAFRHITRIDYNGAGRVPM